MPKSNRNQDNLEAEEAHGSFSSIDSAGSDTSVDSSISVTDDLAQVESDLFDAVCSENRTGLSKIFKTANPAVVLRALVHFSYKNEDGRFAHDPEAVHDAQELLGEAVSPLNIIQCACFLGEEDLALDILMYVDTESEHMEARKILYEFMGKVWGNGNTSLHLASFLGMSDLVNLMLNLGSNTNKRNDRKYKPVDCADDDATRALFLNVTEGHGVLAGLGLGLSYISPVSSLQKWFPDRRGMASGFAVCAFGGGSIVVGLVIRPLVQSFGLGWTLIILGLCYYIPMIFAALILRTPPPNYVVNGLTSDRVPVNTTQDNAITGSEKTDSDVTIDIPTHQPPNIQLTLIESITSREYGLMYIMFFANCITGLVVISRLSNIITEVYRAEFASDREAGDFGALIVSINGVVNLLGRIGFSFISDYIGRKTVFLITLGLHIVILVFIPIMFEADSLHAFVALMFALSACYGSGFGVIPAFLADQFGSKNIGACHGVMLTSWALAGVGGGLVFSTIFKSMTGNIEYRYSFNFHWLLVVVCIGFIVTLFLRTDMKDKLFPSVPGQILRIRIAGRQVRLVKGKGLQILTKEQEDKEWESFLAELHQEKISPSSSSINKQDFP